MENPRSKPDTSTFCIEDALYRAVVEDQTELICRFKGNGVLTFVNGAYCRFFGKTPEELIGRSFYQFLPEAARRTVETRIAELGIDKPAVAYEHSVLLPDGSLGWQEWTDRAVFCTDGRLLEYQSVGRDITRHKESVAALEVQRDLALALGLCRDIEESLDAIVEACLRLPGVDGGGIYFLDQASQRLELVTHRGLGAEFIKNVGSYEAASLQYALMIAGMPAYLDFSDPRFSARETVLREGLRCMGTIPVKTCGRSLGVLNIASHTVERIRETSRLAAEAIAGQVGPLLLRKITGC